MLKTLIPLALAVSLTMVGCAGTLSADQLKTYHKLAYDEAYGNALQMKTKLPDNLSSCQPPCTVAPTLDEVSSFLKSEVGRAYIKSLLYAQLLADGWRLVVNEDGSERYVGGQFLGSQRR
jgi:hypothetical protein